MTYSEIGLLMSYKLAGKRVRQKVFYYAYTPSTHSHTRWSRTGSDTKRVEEFFGFSKFWISADKRRSCVINNEVFGALFKLLAPSKALGSPCQHDTAYQLLSKLNCSPWTSLEEQRWLYYWEMYKKQLITTFYIAQITKYLYLPMLQR